MNKDSKPKVVCFPFVGDSIGGSHRSAILLLKNLDPGRYLPLVVVHEDGPLVSHLREEGITPQFLPLKNIYVGKSKGIVGHLSAIMKTAPTLARFMKRNRVEIVHANDGRMNLTWLPATRYARKKFIWHQRSRYIPSRLTKYQLGFADRVLSISKYCAAPLPNEHDRTCIILDNPFAQNEAIDVDAGSGLLQFDDAFGDENTKVVSFVGNLTKRKRADIFLNAAAKISSDYHHPVKFLLLGADRDGLQDSLERLAGSLGILNQTYFVGFQNPIEPWMNRSDLLLAPQVEEPFGRNIVESMLLHTPVIAADSGGHQDILESGKTGFLVQPDDADAFARTAIQLLTDNDLSRSIADQAFSEASNRYSISNHVNQVMDIYDDLLGVNAPADTRTGSNPVIANE